MVYIYKNKETGEVRFSPLTTAESEVEAWLPLQKSDALSEHLIYWDWGKTQYVESETCFDINPDNTVTFYQNDLQQCVDKGKLILLPTQKIENNQIVLKTDLELLNEGLITQSEYDTRLAAKEEADKQELFHHKRYRAYIKLDDYVKNNETYNGFYYQCTLHPLIEVTNPIIEGQVWLYIYFDEYKDDTQKAQIEYLKGFGLTIEDSQTVTLNLTLV